MPPKIHEIYLKLVVIKAELEIEFAKMPDEPASELNCVSIALRKVEDAIDQLAPL
jgi:hypothetical protein